MRATGSGPVDDEVRTHLAAGDAAAATTAALRAHGPEVFGFLVSLVGKAGDVDEVFARFAEQVWRGLPAFGWQCSLRTWIYGVARHAAFNHLRDHRRRARRQVPLPEGSLLSVLVADVRERTRTYLATEFKDRFAKIRESLSPEDRELLVLRVDRGLEWEEIARVIATDPDAAPDAQTLKREAARLRKRFQLLKKKLLELGRKEGLLGEDA